MQRQPTDVPAERDFALYSNQPSPAQCHYLAVGLLSSHCMSI